MRILAVDQSYTSCGIVVLEGDEILHAQRFVTDKKDDIYDRAWDVANEISDVARRFNLKYIGVEGLAFAMTGNATRDLAGLLFTIVTQLRIVEGYTVYIIPPNTVKKVATGRGNAKKEQLVESLPPYVRDIFDDLGVKKTTGLLDLTDAYWIGKATQIHIKG